MAAISMRTIGFSPQGKPYAQFVGGLFRCPYIIQPSRNVNLLAQIFERGHQWGSAVYPGSTILDIPPDERLDLFRRYREVVTPELINAVPGYAIWRVPFFPGAGRDRYVTDGMVFLLFDLFVGFKFVAIGAEQDRGDIFLSSPLTSSQSLGLENNLFPDSLTEYGIPGPGVCGRPPDARIISGPAVTGPLEGYDPSFAAPQSHGPRLYPQLEAPTRPLGPPPRPVQQQHPRTQRQQAIRGPPRKFASDTVSGSESGSGSDTATEAPRKQPKGKATRKTSKAKPKTRQRSLSDSDEDDQPKRAPKGQAANTKSKAISSRRQRSPSDNDEDYNDDPYFSGREDERSHGATKLKATKDKPKSKASKRQRSPAYGDYDGKDGELELSDDGDSKFDDYGSPTRKHAGKGSAKQSRRRGRSPSDDEDELPAIDEEEKKMLEALKAENGYGKWRDEKKGLH
ncbi:MAG: hypothetical protein L6R41_006677 [Letrouitia leprolyta]|nr:MAG: hypothetical protein L6R41_006677 [Letrouitia leprolyta]